MTRTVPCGRPGKESWFYASRLVARSCRDQGLNKARLPGGRLEGARAGDLSFSGVPVYRGSHGSKLAGERGWTTRGGLSRRPERLPSRKRERGSSRAEQGVATRWRPRGSRGRSRKSRKSGHRRLSRIVVCGRAWKAIQGAEDRSQGEDAVRARTRQLEGGGGIRTRRRRPGGRRGRRTREQRWGAVRRRSRQATAEATTLNKNSGGRRGRR